MCNDLKYVSTINYKGANWEIFSQEIEGGEFIDVWLRQENYGVMYHVIGVKNDENWRDVTAGSIMEYIEIRNGEYE